MPVAKLVRWFKKTRPYRAWVYPFQARLRRQVTPTLAPAVRPLAEQRGWPYRVLHARIIEQREPSRTLAEDMLDIINNGPERVQAHHETLCSGSIERGRMYYSHLYAVTRYPIAETFTCEIPEAIMVGPEGLVITNQFEALAQSTYRRHLAVEPVTTRGLFYRLPRLKGTYLSLLSTSTTYAHWLMDCLPRLAPLERADIKLLIPARPTRYQLESLALLGFSANQLVEVGRQPVRVERLLLAHTAQRSGVPSPVHLARLRDRLLEAAGVPPGPPTRRLYISRAKTSRPVVNESELEPVLAEYGFETVLPETLSFADQVRLFAQAEAILGAHGAGIYNHIFCPAGAVVIEVYNRQRWEHAAHRLACLLGHRHWHIYGEHLGQGWETRLSPGKLAKVLAYALAAEASLYDDPY